MTTTRIYKSICIVKSTPGTSAQLEGLSKTNAKRNAYYKRGYTIAFLGTDGSGKTTIINQVITILNEVYPNTIYYEHLRPNLIPTIAGLLHKKGSNEEPDTDPHIKKQSNFLISLLRFSYYFVDYQWGYLLKILPNKFFHSYIWIFDRYYYDYLFDPMRTRVSLPKWIFKTCMLFMPEPDLIICLGANPKIIHARKAELNILEITRQINELSNFCENHKNTVWVNTSCKIEHSVKKTMDIIYEKMIEHKKKVY